MRWDHGGWGAGRFVAMSLVMLVFWTLLVAVVVWLVRITRQDADRPNPARPSPRRAEEVLAERFARGEIDEEEYVRRRDLLRSG